MPFRIGPAELCLIAFLAFLIFGPNRVAKLGKEAGEGVKAFVKSMREINTEDHSE